MAHALRSLVARPEVQRLGYKVRGVNVLLQQEKTIGTPVMGSTHGEWVDGCPVKVG